MKIIALFFLTLSIQSYAQNCSPLNSPPTEITFKAINNLKSFSYIRHAIKEAQQKINQNTVTCISLITLGKNEYQYNRYYIKVDILLSHSQLNSHSSPVYSFQFLFQDASVQAFHNVGGQPWYGIARNQTIQINHKLIKKYSFKVLKSVEWTPSQSPIEVVKLTDTYQKNKETIDLQSLSSIELETNTETKYFLSTWLPKSKDQLFAEYYPLNGVLLSIDKHNIIRVAYGVDLYQDFLLPIQQDYDRQLSNLKAHENWIQLLLKISSNLY